MQINQVQLTQEKLSTRRAPKVTGATQWAVYNLASSVVVVALWSSVSAIVSTLMSR